jgi:hypothetical protein
MPKTLESPKRVTADEIAEMADRGEDISRFFTNVGKMMPPIQRVNVDFALPMLQELDEAARQLNISRQAVIKTLLRQALDQQHLARRAR